jgi:prevent-host-death family protein
MKSYKISEAREQFAAIVKQAEEGEEIVLMRHGKPVVTIQAVKGAVPGPGFMADAGWSVRMAEDFDSIPTGFEEYV